MNDEARQDSGAETGGQPQSPWSNAVPGQRSPQAPVPPANNPAPENWPPAPESPFAPPSAGSPYPPAPALPVDQQFTAQSQPPQPPHPGDQPFPPPGTDSPFAPVPPGVGQYPQQPGPSWPPAGADPETHTWTVPAGPVSGGPQSGQGDQPFASGPVSAPPQGADEPFATTPYPSWPPAGDPSATPPWTSSFQTGPVSAPPQGGEQPFAPGPVSVPPQPQPQPPHTPDQPFQTWADPRSTAGPARIVPSPPRPNRSRFIIGLAIGLAVAVLVGVGGYFFGAQGGKPDATPSAAPSAALNPFEASQMLLNRPKFSGDLVPLAEPWLPYVGGCLTNDDAGGPKLPADASKYVVCRYGGVNVQFAQFKSRDELNTERTYREQLNLTTGSLAPGQQPPAPTNGGVSGAKGNYVEYALKTGDGRALCGIWWDRDGSSAALLMEAMCKEDLGNSWAPLRDLWQRYS
ncbi:hypothetical protein [Rugosimonospora africana]|uniref:hypothetical protein n=1 Tax=Rugosimonospora africana TaxID=556532 RepID=UPI001940E2C4|nr:hypothetical protein [Rugosimonospora africana]